MSCLLLSINVGRLQPLAGDGPATGHYKVPQAGTWQIDSLGLAQDAIADQRHHGGPDQAVYVYSAQDYAWWEQQLGQKWAFGTLGENLTVSHFPAPPRIGDCWTIGEVLLQVTAPRIPCATLAARLGDGKFVKKFAAANRGGFYARVLRSGLLEAGQSIIVQAFAGLTVEVDEVFALWHRRRKDRRVLEAALAAPLGQRARQALTRWLLELAD
jgi:MOSC domain-containing protein YiiM